MRGKQPVGEILAECAREMKMPVATLRDQLGTIRAFPRKLLTYWLQYISFSHISLACYYMPDDPESLINEAITLGDGEGRTMTCEQMVAFATGGLVRPKLVVRFTKAMDRLKRNFR